MKQPYVSTLIEQDFSDEEKARARDNISALSSADLGPYATETWVSDNFLSDGDFRDFVTQEELESATSGKQDKLTAGPNIDIIDHIISTEKTVVAAGAGVSIHSYQEPQTRTTTYEISSSGATYTAGQYISIDENNVITASGIQPELPVPTEASYLVGTPTGNMRWKARNQFMYISDLSNHVLTQDDLNNGYCDIPINWNVPSTSRVYDFTFCMDLSDMYADRGNGIIYPLDTRVEKIKCSIYNEGENTWYSNDNAHGSDPLGMVFEDILGSELSRVTSYWTLNKEVKRAGMTGPYSLSFSGPSFRVVFVQNHYLQVGDKIVMTGRISGIDFKNGGW